MERRHSDRFWALLLGLAFAVCAAAALLLMNGRPSGRVLARITVDGETVRVIDLSAVGEETGFTVETEAGVNVISLRPGGICVSRADCPDQVCVRQGWLESGYAPIVCLPHGLVISLESPEGGGGFDAVAG